MHRRSEAGMQEVIQMCSSFDANKSTKGASKLRRDLINGEIANLRDLLPLPSSTRQRLSQLQLMALVCVYVRKANYFQQVFKRHHELGHPYSTPNIGFSKALSGFLIMMTQNGKLLYISDNAAEYLGHSMEDLLIHGDSVYDIIDKADHGTVQAELLRSSNSQNPPGEETRLFLCRMNVSRNARRQMRFGDQKVVLLQGHYLSYLPLCSRNEPVFVATCTPVAMPETRECVVQGATNVFTTIHAMDMKFMHIDRNGEYYLGYTRSELGGISWYQLIHWNYMREAQSKHRLISQSEQEKSCILLLRLQTRSGDWIWVHCVLQVKDGSDNQQQQQSVIVATNQVLSEREAAVMRANSWLYHYYTVQTKLQYGLAYPEATGTQGSPTAAAAAARLAAAAYFPTPQLMNYGSHSHQPHAHHLHHHPHHHSHHHPHHPHAHHQISPDTSGGYATAMPPPLHSPHNGSYSSSGTPGHPYHHHHHHQLQHAFEMSAAAAAAAAATGTSGGGKESPLDFSLAASSVFEFPMTSGYTAGSSYWTHHHHPHSHPHSHGYSSSAAGNSGSTAPLRAIEGSPSTSSSTVSSSALSPHTWSLLPSSVSNTHHNSNTHNSQSHQQTLHHANSHSSPPTNSSARISNLSPNTNNNHHGISRKRLKKNSEVVSETSSPPLGSNRSSSSTHGFILPNGANGGSGPAGPDCSVATLSTPFPYHTRHRGYYKVFGASQEIEEHTPVKEEALAIMTMACPLTPSPIWEGQTQRVPDLQFYCGERGDPGSGAPGLTNGGDLIHCVPTYQPYLPFCSTTNPAANALGTAAIQMQMQMMESGSPNKENRLPPTPESDQSENDENRPIKWETL